MMWQFLIKTKEISVKKVLKISQTHSHHAKNLKLMEGIKYEITYHTAAIITSIFVELYLKKKKKKHWIK